MARSVGLPTRIAVGYSYGTPQSGTWHIKNKDAHAWPEVYFSGLGWVPLEPTPGRGANAPGGTGDPTQRPQESATQAVPETTTPTSAGGVTPPPSLGSPQANQEEVTLGQDGTTESRPRSSVGQFFVALAFIAIVLAVLALIGAARARRARDAALVAPPPRGRSARRACSARGPRPSIIWPMRVSSRNRRRLPSSSRCAMRRPTAPATRARPSWSSRNCRRRRCSRPIRRARTMRTAAWVQVDAIDGALSHSISAITRWRRRLDPRRLGLNPA